MIDNSKVVFSSKSKLSFYKKKFVVVLLDFGPGQLHVMKLDFISQPSSKSTLLLAGLQHMQQCQVGWNITFYLFAPGY